MIALIDMKTKKVLEKYNCSIASRGFISVEA